MEITKSGSAPDLTIAVAGRLDTTTAPQLQEEIDASIPGITSLVFDLADLEYISSAGLRVLLYAQKAMNKQGKMTIRNAQEAVMDVFDVTGFSEILTFEG